MAPADVYYSFHRLRSILISARLYDSDKLHENKMIFLNLCNVCVNTQENKAKQMALKIYLIIVVDHPLNMLLSQPNLN